MDRYIGTKVINAKPMRRNEYHVFRGWEEKNFLEPESADGYLVEYTDGGNPNTDEFKGYVSWSPKEPFEKAYRKCNNLTFGLALEVLKKGSKVARLGWNGKGLWLELQRPDEFSKMTLPYVYLNYPMDAQNTPGARVPWLASQTDLLAEDWVIVE